MDLHDLRNRLGEIDAHILELAAERQRLATDIGRAKRAQGRSTRDFAQEKEVMQRACEAARRVGLPEAMAEQLTETLVRFSLTVQEQDQLTSLANGTGRRVLVIGGAGRMGRWFVRFLSSQDFFVEVADPGGAVDGVPCHRDWEALELDHELIVIAAPLPTTNNILHALARRPPRGIVFDIGSLKSPIRSGLYALRDAGGRVTSTHPMFGAAAELLSSRHVVFVDLGDADATAAVKALFEPTMASLVDMDLESHDRLIAYVLGLSHALNLAFLSALAGSGEAALRLAELSSTTFEAQLGVSRRVAAENPHLYFEIQALNDYGSESLAALLSAVERIRSLVRAGDQRGFVELMQQCDSYLSSRG